MHKIASASADDILCSLDLTAIDWNKIQAETKALKKRTPQDCELQMLMHLHPGINRSAWTRSEEKRLLELATQFKNTRWMDITQQLGTNRTVAEVFRKFQRSMNPMFDVLASSSTCSQPYRLKPKAWSKAEDKLLLQAVEDLGDNWTAVASNLENRTSGQCAARFQKLTATKRSKFAFEEDIKLKLLVIALLLVCWR